MKPIIGLNADLRISGDRSYVQLRSAYALAIATAGGAPVILSIHSAGALSDLMAHVDGIMLVGGDDYHPSLYGESPHASLQPMPAERQDFDLALARLTIARNVPLLGVCGGCQLLNLAAGGSLVQDIPVQIGTSTSHRGSNGTTVFHEISVKEGSSLERLMGTKPVVNSRHHQAVGQPGKNIEVLARASDGVIEALSLRGHPFALGVQWHPEELLHLPEHLSLFRALVEAALAAKVSFP